MFGLGLYDISWMSTWQVVNNTVSTGRIASVVTGTMCYMLPLWRDWNPFTTVRYNLLDAQRCFQGCHQWSLGCWKGYNYHCCCHWPWRHYPYHVHPCTVHFHTCNSHSSLSAPPAVCSLAAASTLASVFCGSPYNWKWELPSTLLISGYMSSHLFDHC